MKKIKKKKDLLIDTNEILNHPIENILKQDNIGKY